MLVALVVIAALWITAGIVVVAATNRPAYSIALALADTTPVMHSNAVELAA